MDRSAWFASQPPLVFLVHLKNNNLVCDGWLSLSIAAEKIKTPKAPEKIKKICSRL